MKVKTMTYRNGLFFNNEYIEMNVEREFVGCASPSHRVAGNAGSIGKFFPTVGGGGAQVPLLSRIDPVTSSLLLYAVHFILWYSEQIGCKI